MPELVVGRGGGGELHNVLVHSLAPGRNYIPPRCGHKAFLRGRGGGVYFEAPGGKICIAPPLLYAPLPWEGVFRGGGRCIKFGPHLCRCGPFPPQGDGEAVMGYDDDSVGERPHGMPTAYSLRAQIVFRNRRSMNIGNTEKHAQPTFTEAFQLCRVCIEEHADEPQSPAGPKS